MAREIMNKLKIKLSGKLFLIEMSLFLVFVIFTITYQFYRERDYQTEYLDNRLQEYNYHIKELIDSNRAGLDSTLADYAAIYQKEGLRITVIKDDGTVVFDTDMNAAAMENHKSREEIAGAMNDGKGKAIRTSESLNKDYFYSATHFEDDGMIVRTSMPYSLDVLKHINDDSRFIWVSLLVMILIAGVYYYYIRKIQTIISKLREFARKVENNENIDDTKFTFPNNELGEIAEHVVYLYSELKKSEEDKTRLKRQLTQNIAHELKTPVNSIQGFLETIVHNPDMAEDKKKEFLERCYAQSERLSYLLRDISSLIRMDEAENTFEIGNVNLSELVHEIEKDTAQQLAAKRMKMLILLRSDINVNGNYSLLYSVFRNLTDNAIAYAGEGTTITVKLAGEANGFYTISFADNGVGVPKEHLDHLFERFYRIDKGRSRKLGGTGLGLAIVKNAVLMHKGTIHARIANTGGVEFIFTLPKTQAADKDKK